MKYQSPYFVAIEIEGFENNTLTTENGLKLYKSTQKIGTKEKSYYTHADNIKGKVVGLSVKSGNKSINNSKSFPATYEEKRVRQTTEAGGVKVELGDIVYFHYLSVQQPMVLDRCDNKITIAVAYHDLYCKVIDGEIQMLNHYIMYEPYHGEDVEEHSAGELTIKGKKIKYGSLELILPTSGRMVAHGKVIANNEGFEGCELPGVHNGDVVLVHKKREQEIEIEGRIVYVTWNTNVFAKILDGEIIPVGRYVTIQPQRPQIESSLIILDITLDKEKIDTGIVTATGMECSGDVLAGDTVRFNEYIEFEGYDEFLVFEGQIVYRIEQV